MKKRILVLVLAVALTAVFGCAPQPGRNKPGKGAAKKNELIWLMGDPGTVPADQNIVENRLNEISEKKLGVRMRTLYYDNDRTMLALSSGENWDMTFTCEWFNNYAVQAYAGYFADLTDKLKTVTPDLYATMPDIVWEGAKVNGKIMAIPVKKDYAAELFWRFDKKLFVDKLGMDVKAEMDFFGVEDYLSAAKKAYDEGIEEAKDAQYPLKLNKGGLAGLDAGFDMINRDALLGIPYSAVGTANENKIVLTIEHEDLSKRLEAMHKWNKAGYINPDAPTTEEISIYSAVKNGQGFFGADAIWSSGDNYQQVISKYSGPFLSTASIRGSMNAINANSDKIDMALKYQQLVNTDKEYRDILRYGVEGTHFNYTENGLVKRTERGLKSYGPWAFSQGSYSLSSVEAAEGVKVDPKMWEVVFKGYEDLVATNSIGFSFDISKVESQVAACKVVKDKYWTGFATGSIDPAKEIPKLVKELESAGIRDIIKEAQKQYDDFVASKKNNKGEAGKS